MQIYGAGNPPHGPGEIRQCPAYFTEHFSEVMSLHCINFSTLQYIGFPLRTRWQGRLELFQAPSFN